MAAEPAVLLDARHVSVTYRVYEQRALGLRERVLGGNLRRAYREIRAVQDVSLVLRRGDSLGLVGPNGSGKSTLLSALTGLIPVESGDIFVRSRPTFLSVGTAMQGELTGRRNIVLGCLASGMTRAEIAGKVDDIIEFSGLSDAIDLPMKTYSSGMRARLVFSVATARIPEILLIDEALAVGDQHFRQKSSARIAEIRAQAGAVVLVSHNLAEIGQSCTRVMWLEHGRVVMEGPTDEVLERYTAGLAG